MNEFQDAVRKWTNYTFGEEISNDKTERNHRFLEEALELVQSLKCTKEEAHMLVDYVYARPVGDPHQELGGVMITLAALVNANRMDMETAGWDEHERIWKKQIKYEKNKKINQKIRLSLNNVLTS